MYLYTPERVRKENRGLLACKSKKVFAKNLGRGFYPQMPYAEPKTFANKILAKCLAERLRANLGGVNI